MWELDPEAEFLSAFMNIVRCHRSPNNGNKLKALFAFKMEVGKRYAEFLDMGQKDAHEFLTSFLDHIRSLCPVITGLPGMADIYVCPIQKHLMFKMKSTRACMECGQRSMNEEVFNNLSLNLVPQESVKEMLDNYLLSWNAIVSVVAQTTTQCYSFDTLPRILILHVKHFCFTPLFTPKKLLNPINISRELIISSTQDFSCCVRDVGATFSNYKFTGSPWRCQQEIKCHAVL
ncbi:ubiquitin carboxyl-terminal hydrolase 37-like [Paralichthys olivaceus]|uniref:ubiquitin carboxyl-terminal hydrolase 37-like n=1 Tax=Paralichthys olivaceus TaxID=8255 RepID=UPI0037504046